MVETTPIRFSVVTISLPVIVATLATAALAQAPAPKVTITGPFDQVTSAFDLLGAALKAGHALDTAEVLNGVHTRRKAHDAYLLAARIRLAF